MPKRTVKPKEDESVDVPVKVTKKERAKPKKTVETLKNGNEPTVEESNKRPTRVAKTKNEQKKNNDNATIVAGKSTKEDQSDTEDSENSEEMNKENTKGKKKASKARKVKLDALEKEEDEESVSKVKKARNTREKKVKESGDDVEESLEKEPKKASKKQPKKPTNEDDVDHVVKKRAAPKKATKKTKEDSEDEETVPETKAPAKKAAPKSGEKKPVKNKTETDFSAIDYSCKRLNQNGDKWNFKISSWNVDGIRAWCSKGCLEYINHEKPDIFCIQETKCSLGKLPDEVKVDGYHAYWNAAEKDGYSGVGLYSKEQPLCVVNGIESPEHDDEGRIITAEFEKFYVISVYVPNSGRGLVTLPKRLDWNAAFLQYLKKLDAKKPVIICGDMNVAHLEIDLKNPKTNKKNAGFTQEERDGMTELLADGFVDTFRNIYPDKEGVYTFWTYMSNSRAKNTGWRLDYFLVSERFMPSICDHAVRTEAFGSDHCPITLFLHV